MKYYKIKYANESEEIVVAEKALDVIRRYDLTSKEHIHTKIIELGEAPLWSDCKIVGGE